MEKDNIKKRIFYNINFNNYYIYSSVLSENKQCLYNYELKVCKQIGKENFKKI